VSLRDRIAVSSAVAVTTQSRFERSDLVFLVRPLGFEPRTCGLRVSSEPFLTVPDSYGQAHYQGLQALTVSDRV
jgi:hypothetical protein